MNKDMIDKIIRALKYADVDRMTRCEFKVAKALVDGGVAKWDAGFDGFTYLTEVRPRKLPAASEGN